jgi:hypothetical protein
MATKFCRHIRINGERCGSPALTSQPFCYYHVEQSRRHRRSSPRPDPTPTVLHPMTLQDGTQRDRVLAEFPAEYPAEYPNPHLAAPLQLDFPPLEDRHSIQLALSMLITALAQDRIDPRRGALLFYGLQIASSNARNLNPLPPKHQIPGKVRQTILDEATGALIAPDEDPEDSEDSQDFKPGGSWQGLLKQLDEQKAQKAERDRLAADLQRSMPPPS